MNGIKTHRLHIFEARPVLRPDHARPVRMQSAGWGLAAEMRSAAWRRGLRDRGIWRRCLVVGGLAAAATSGLGVGQSVVAGVGMGMGCLLVQCWQFVDDCTHRNRVSTN